MTGQTVFSVLEQIGSLLAATPFSHTTSWQKDDSTIVTNLDLQLQEQMLAIIQREFPHHNLIYEEGDRQFINHGSQYTWVIDPIDGTANFASGKKEYGSSVGVMWGAEFIAALVSFPALGETYTGHRDGGLMLNGESCSPGVSIDDSNETTLCSRSFPLLKGAFSRKGFTPSFYYCATYSLLRVLKGKSAMFLAVTTNLYDVGPMAFLLELAGHGCYGRDGASLRFEPSPRRIPFFLAVNSRRKPEEFMTIIGDNLNGT